LPSLAASIESGLRGPRKKKKKKEGYRGKKFSWGVKNKPPLAAFFTLL
jgi:hypothetical protein